MWNTLSKDSQQHIFSFFDVKTLLKAAGISKSWKTLADSNSNWKKFIEHPKDNETESFKPIYFKQQLSNLISRENELTPKLKKRFKDKIIRSLIIKTYLSVDYLLVLKESQIGNLSNPCIYQLIIKSYVIIEDLVGLNQHEITCLSDNRIYNLIFRDFLKISDVKCLRDNERNNLASRGVQELIKKERLKVKKAKKLEHHQITNLNDLTLLDKICKNEIPLKVAMNYTSQQRNQLKTCP